MLIELARAAKAGGVGLTVDAEESERLEISLSIIEGAARDPTLAGWDGLGMAVQAYTRRAPAVIGWAGALAGATNRRLMVRLVKGAYWDTEIKRAQERGVADYPVFTRKSGTDISFMACAKAMLGESRLFPAFATHNALTVATVLEWAGDRRDLEFQRLHGMGEGLYEDLMASRGLAVRIYAPVGGYRDLLAYLVRRLLENGANTSFVHQIADRDLPDEVLLADPVAVAEETGLTAHSAIPTPPNLYAPERRNSAGLDLSDDALVADLIGAMEKTWAVPAEAAPVVDGKDRAGAARAVVDPADASRRIGTVVEADAAPRRGGHLHRRPISSRSGTRGAPTPAPRSWNASPTSSNATAPNSWPWRSARPAKPWPMRWARFGRPWTSVAITPCKPESTARRSACLGRPASSTNSASRAGASSPVSVRGTSRSLSSSARSPRPWPPGTPWSPSRRPRHP